jgi:aerobic-type carbon monoxide dehydrogenase small subunit (CoxS/CutS family)
MVISSAALLERSSHPTQAEIIGQLNGNVCRCGCYPRIIEAVARASELLRSKSGG